MAVQPWRARTAKLGTRQKYLDIIINARRCIS